MLWKAVRGNKASDAIIAVMTTMVEVSCVACNSEDEVEALILHYGELSARIARKRFADMKQNRNPMESRCVH